MKKYALINYDPTENYPIFICDSRSDAEELALSFSEERTYNALEFYKSVEDYLETQKRRWNYYKTHKDSNGDLYRVEKTFEGYLLLIYDHFDIREIVEVK